MGFAPIFVYTNLGVLRKEVIKVYKIVLNNGKTFENLVKENDYFISETELKKEDFEDLENVSITNDLGQTDMYEHMRFIDLFKKDYGEGEKYFFCIIPVSESDIRERIGISYLASLLLTDEQAVKAAFLFDEWDPNGIKYGVDDKVQYNDILCKCLQAHTSQESWNPKDASSLWVRIDDPSEEWPEWRQPSGSVDAYSKGYKVSHNGKHWTSDVDNNTWEPGVYGWTEVVEE